MKFRHELKHEITLQDKMILEQRLSSVLSKDINGIDGKYQVRSLYFDNIYDSALMEKINGISIREKFRLRLYNGNTNFIVLEKKSKINGLCNKVSCNLSENETRKILIGDIEFMKNSNKNLLRELYLKMKTQGLLPKTIVEYTRKAFTFKEGNVRITLDYNIKSGVYNKGFLDKTFPCVTTGNEIVLEVKWDEYLPSVVRKIVGLQNIKSTAFSKYAKCRMYG